MRPQRLSCAMRYRRLSCTLGRSRAWETLVSASSVTLIRYWHSRAPSVTLVRCRRLSCAVSDSLTLLNLVEFSLEWSKFKLAFSIFFLTLVHSKLLSFSREKQFSLLTFSLKWVAGTFLPSFSCGLKLWRALTYCHAVFNSRLISLSISPVIKLAFHASLEREIHCCYFYASLLLFLKKFVIK